MNQPSLDDLMKVIESKYTLVVVASKRARQLTEGDMSFLPDRPIKPVTAALHEILRGKIVYERTKIGIK
ncbi:MAG: DNA-directed RNA polymerase subunit omega [Bacillota bacterium]